MNLGGGNNVVVIVFFFNTRPEYVTSVLVCLFIAVGRAIRSANPQNMCI